MTIVGIYSNIPFMASTANPREIHNFTSLANQWWNEDGPMKPLHALNPVRMGILKKWLGGDVKGLKILDIGCGGGLVCEPLARMGAIVTGIDAGAENIEAARKHAKETGLNIDYQCSTAEEFLDSSLSRKTGEGRGEGFDAVLALEIIEHVDNPALFMESVVKFCKPGGTIIVSTLNRTPKSFALGIVAAEYILRWVPKGTHSWRKFKKPSELAAMLEGAKVTGITGLIFNPLTRQFEEHKSDIDVNYFLCAVRDNK
jgi:2-polyprenyl-6-hydroxyphenyl methylase/3-demethylubiquinone-9 3-methyltransferase